VYDKALRLEDMKAALGTIEAWVVAAAQKDAQVGERAANVVPISWK
jgi:hypothetical protein